MTFKKVRVIRKAYVLLLEMLIAMGLTFVILSSLMFFYHQVNLINAEMDREQNESFKKLYLENRLSNILPKAVSSTDPSTDFHFFTSQDIGGLSKQGMPSLVFTFDNGVQLDKQMSYHVIGRLFLDPDGNLMLAKWPVEKRWKENEAPPLTKEVLLDNVESLSFAFFVPPDKSKGVVAEEKQPPQAQVKLEIPQELKGRWVDVWNKEYHQLPAIVKMIVTRKDRFGKDEILIFAFPLPHTLNPVTYDE